MSSSATATGLSARFAISPARRRKDRLARASILAATFIALVPLALKGVKYRAIGATALLRRNLIIYGLGGVILPFVGIKLIDLIVHNLLGA